MQVPRLPQRRASFIQLPHQGSHANLNPNPSPREPTVKVSPETILFTSQVQERVQ